MGAREVRAGGAYVEVSTKDSTDKGLAGIKGKLKAFGNGINKIKGVAVGVASTAGAATAAAVKKAIDTGSAIKDMADRFGLSYVAVQRLGFVADQTGSSIETLAGGIKKMQQGLGNGTLGDELTAIGISLSDIQGKSPEQQFAMIATAIDKISDPAKKTAAAMAIFGKAGSELVPLTGEIQGLMATFDGLGVTMGDAAVEQAEALGDEIDKVTKRFESLVVKLGAGLLPILQKVIDKIPDTSAEYGGAAIADLVQGGNDNMRAAIRSSNTRATATAQKAYDEAMEGRRLSEARREAREAGTAVPGDGNSPLGQWLKNMGARSANMNRSAAAREQIQPGIDIFKGVAKEWERIGRNVERDQNKERIRERRAIEGDLKSVNKQIADEMAKTVSFGSFDKRDLMGGVFNDIGHQQLKELRESKKLLERQLAALMKLKPGLPVG